MFRPGTEGQSFDGQSGVVWSGGCSDAGLTPPTPAHLPTSAAAVTLLRPPQLPLSSGGPSEMRFF